MPTTLTIKKLIKSTHTTLFQRTLEFDLKITKNNKNSTSFKRILQKNKKILTSRVLSESKRIPPSDEARPK